MILIVFGLPGVGKTFVGKILENYFGFYLHDGDVDLPNEMRVTLEQNGNVTGKMRNIFFHNILKSLDRLNSGHKNIVVTQTFIKEKYRVWIKEKYPAAKFLLVTTPDDIREKRLKKRSEYPLDITYSRQMVENFDEPQIGHITIDNTIEGDEHIRKQLVEILNSMQNSTIIKAENL